jgi:amino-acid N-acetyltransferase
MRKLVRVLSETNEAYGEAGAGRQYIPAGHGPRGGGLPAPGNRLWWTAMGYTVRQARTADVPGISGLIEANVESGRLLNKATVTLYEDIQEFWVAERDPDGLLAGCGALHVLWEDLAEIRTIAVRADCQGHGIGRRIAQALLRRARELGVERVFVLTFAVNFFASLGFEEIFGTPVAPDVYTELLRSYDEGVAEFLGLDWVKPNTLGNTRMLLRL